MCGKVCVTHCHLQGLVTEPHLHTPYIYAATHETRRTCMAQNMRNDLIICTETDFNFRVIPYLPESYLIEHGEGAFQPLMRNFGRFSCAFSQWNGSTAVRFGQPERNTMFLDIIPGESDCFTKTAATVDEKNG